MSMSFGSLLRGRIAERILVTLFERGGFRVTRLGIEELFDEVKLLPKKQYLDLGLPPALRAMPDLLIADPKVSWAKLVEVKFRQRFDLDIAKELHEKLTEQRKYWPDAYAVVMVSEPPEGGGNFHQDQLRVVPPNEVDLLVKQNCLKLEGQLYSLPQDAKSVWSRLPPLTRLIPHVGKAATLEEKERAGLFWGAADDITTAIRELGKI